MFKSVCTFLCQNCWLAGDRSESYRVEHGHVGDRCPRCGSDDVEVRSPHYSNDYDN